MKELKLFHVRVTLFVEKQLCRQGTVHETAPLLTESSWQCVPHPCSQARCVPSTALHELSPREALLLAAAPLCCALAEMDHEEKAKFGVSRAGSGSVLWLQTEHLWLAGRRERRAPGWACHLSWQGTCVHSFCLVNVASPTILWQLFLCLNMASQEFEIHPFREIRRGGTRPVEKVWQWSIHPPSLSIHLQKTVHHDPKGRILAGTCARLVFH